MPVWQPRSGEVLLSRGPVKFATGMAPAVAGMRWFRDTERNDIQHELPGWPEGPTYRIRSGADRHSRGAAQTIGRALFGAVVGILGVGDTGLSGRPMDRANEVDDFPVMWGAPGSIARTLPWLLDPARRPSARHDGMKQVMRRVGAHHGEDRITHLVVTNQRLVVVGLVDTEFVEHDDLLWETERENIAKVEPMDFSENQSDMRIEFADRSWCRLSSNYREHLCRYLIYPLELVEPEDLTLGQRRRVEAFAAKWGISGATPVVTRRPSGNYLVQMQMVAETSSFAGISSQIDRMGPEGENVEYMDGDL